MRRILAWLIWLPVAVVIIAFVVANREWVVLSLDPVDANAPMLSLNLPLWAVFVLGLFIGIAVGWSGHWLKWRGKYARNRRRIAELEKRERETASQPKPQQADDEGEHIPLIGG